MSMSSPFRESHRRTRSHSSLSSPCTSPVPCHSHDQWRCPAQRDHACPKTLPCSAQAFGAPFAFVSPELASQPPEKWDVEMWRRGKRARCEPSTPMEDTEMDMYEEPMSGLPDADITSAAPGWASSAPSTPSLPSSSDAFQFFPSRSATSRRGILPTTAASNSGEVQSTGTSHVEGLAQLQADAFSDLRKSVEEAGEGFVRRMREFEAHRSTAGAGNSPNTTNRKSVHKRGRKRPSPISSRQAALPSIGTAHKQEENDSDVEIFSGRTASSDGHASWSPCKKRAVSMDALNDLCYAPQPQFIPIHRGQKSRKVTRDRSSSSSERMEGSGGSVYSMSSDEEADGFVLDMGQAERARTQHRSRSRTGASSTESATPSLSLSFTSANSSLSSLPLGPPTSILRSSQTTLRSNTDFNSSPARRQSLSFGNPPSSLPPRNAKRAEKAVAALSLALANGAGSVSDYEALRNAQNVLELDDGEVGSLWD